MGPPDGLKAQYRQSSFFAPPFGRDRIRKRAQTFVPDLNEDAHIDRQILELMAQKVPLGEIATRLPPGFRSSSRTGRTPSGGSEIWRVDIADELS